MKVLPFNRFKFEKKEVKIPLEREDIPFLKHC